jgi:DNA-binding response OmpR family regulator
MPEDLLAWVNEDFYDAVLINFDKAPWGVSAVRSIRNHNPITTIVGLSGQCENITWSDRRALFLENGGDDLIHNPVNPRELIASLNAVGRRSKPFLFDGFESTIGQAHIVVNLSAREVQINEQAVHFTHSEFCLLALLINNHGRLQSRERLYWELYTASEYKADSNTLNAFVKNIRNKLKAIHPDARDLIQTVWGVGYLIPSPIDVVANSIPST